jgi:L-iditol 2-dehydrogenase
MLAARLHGPRDVRVDVVADAGRPLHGCALVRVAAVGICGSDLTVYRAASCGPDDRRPLILGHEASGVIVECGGDGLQAADGSELQPGLRVAIDPAQSCGHCDLCDAGHPNLCRSLRFLGVSADDGAMCELMHVPARCCYPLPTNMSFATGALLETLGVAIHAVDLVKIRAGNSVAVFGAGPIGLCIIQVARLAGAAQVFVADPLDVRRIVAEHMGGIPVGADGDPVEEITSRTAGLGVDVAIEAAWGGSAVQQAAEVCRPGARVVLVGIPEHDELTLRHSVARRKGLTIKLCRRMKHTYPRAMEFVESGRVQLELLVSHRFSLRRAAEAFALNEAYADRVIKAIILPQETTDAP